MNSYLQKYESFKKKKKTKKSYIIDDDVVLNNHIDDNIENIYEGLKEDEPVVESFLAISANTYTNELWKPLGQNREASQLRHDSDSDDDLSPTRLNNSIKVEASDSDLSPTRPESNAPLNILDTYDEPENEEIIKSQLKQAKMDKFEKLKLAKEQQYKVWQKGAKQIEEKREEFKDTQALFDKPLTRYQDDKDLDAMLKQKIHEDDPLAAFFAKNNRTTINTKTNQQSLPPAKPKYRGSFKLNRFNIPPGYRWDGVDRSNGFEDRYFKRQANASAMKELAYKWSTEDM